MTYNWESPQTSICQLRTQNRPGKLPDKHSLCFFAKEIHLTPGAVENRIGRQDMECERRERNGEAVKEMGRQGKKWGVKERNGEAGRHSERQGEGGEPKLFF